MKKLKKKKEASRLTHEGSQVVETGECSTPGLHMGQHTHEKSKFSTNMGETDVVEMTLSFSAVPAPFS